MTLAAAFFPFVVVCCRCDHPLPVEEAVAVVNAGQWDGFAHRECPV